MASVTKSPGSASSVSKAGYTSNPWSNPTNVATSDNSYATCTLSAGAATRTSYILMAYNYGFQIPANAVITGIKARVECHRDHSEYDTSLSYVYLCKDNANTGNNKAGPAVPLSTDQYLIFGGDSDLWGATWTPEEINDSNFCLGLGFTKPHRSYGSVTASVDHVEVTVHYTEEITIEPPACEATIAGISPAVKKRLTASTAGATLSTGEHYITHAVPSPSAGVDAAGVSPKLVSILYGVAGELSATPHVDVNLIWIARTAAASLEVSLPEPMIITGDWIIRPSPCVLVDALPAPSIREALSVASAGSVIDAWPPSVLFSAPAEACFASLDGLEPELMQVLRAPSLESTAEVKAPALLFLVPADVCGLTASFSVPLVGHRITVESAEMSGSFIPPGILEAVRAVTAGVVFYGIPFASTYDVLIRATAAGITCGADSPEVLCILWRRESTPESSSTWTRIEHDASIWSKDIAQAASAWTKVTK